MFAQHFPATLPATDRLLLLSLLQNRSSDLQVGSLLKLRAYKLRDHAWLPRDRGGRHDP